MEERVVSRAEDIRAVDSEGFDKVILLGLRGDGGKYLSDLEQDQRID